MKRVVAALALAFVAVSPCTAEQRPVGPVNTLQEMGVALWSC